MKIRSAFIAAVLILLANLLNVTAQQARFFRLSGPASSWISEFRADGSMVWSNAMAGTNYTLQTLSNGLPGGAWIDYAKLPATTAWCTNRVRDPKPPSGMVFIPGGIFQMGDSLDGDIANATPIHVTVSSFYLDAYMVTHSQWRTIYTWATNHGYAFANIGSGKASNHPVQTLNWFDALKWCNARAQMDGLTPVFYLDPALSQVFTNAEGYGAPGAPYVRANWDANGYRLPTEAEWEKAARGGLHQQRFPWGSTISWTQANYPGSGGSVSYDLAPAGYKSSVTVGGNPYTVPIGQYPPNGYGLHDMAGNMGSWCWDFGGYAYAGGTDPRGPAGTTFGYYRVIRGGCWSYTAQNLRCAKRDNRQASTADNSIGFRCARSRNE